MTADLSFPGRRGLVQRVTAQRVGLRGQRGAGGACQSRQQAEQAPLASLRNSFECVHACWVFVRRRMCELSVCASGWGMSSGFGTLPGLDLALKKHKDGEENGC